GRGPAALLSWGRGNGYHRTPLPQSYGDWTTMRMRLHGPRFVLALAGLLAACAVAGAGNWPRFRGPNGSGVAAAQDVPVTWTADKGVLWKVDLPGPGNSSPVIWGDRLFLQSATPRERLLLCLDANTGKVLWKRSAPGGTARIHKLNSLASGTPATDGRHVYCT